MPHIELYGQLRQAILARHFALGRFNRANHFSNDNHLGEFPVPRAGENLRQGCIDFGDGPLPVPMRNGIPLYQQATDLLSRPDLQLERWRVLRHERANPLMMTGLRLVSLSIEHHLGHADAAPLVRTILRTTDSLMKFRLADGSPSPFEGYILRWDPATTDDWTVRRDTKGVETPEICCEFLVNHDPKTFGRQHFLYCTPLNDSRYLRKAADRQSKGLLRRWEPSMDEYVGLVCGYFMVWLMFKNDTASAAQDIVQEVKAQLRRVATYLRHVGYLLVRPCGGFTALGSSGANPALEFAFSRIFYRVLGDAFAVPRENDFDDAIRKAGLWSCWQRHPPVDAIRLRAFGDSLQLDELLRSLLGPHPIQALRDFFGNDASVNAALENAATVASRLDCIDVLSAEGRNDFIVAAIIKRMAAVSPRATFTLFMQKSSAEGSWSDYFKPFLGLTALDDPDPTVAQNYLAWYRHNVWPNANGHDQLETLGTERWGVSVFATAVAVALDQSSPTDQYDMERRLEKELQLMHDVLQERASCNLVLHNRDGGGGETQDKNVEGRSNWYGYLAPLSVAWLRQGRLSIHDRAINNTSPLPAIQRPNAATMTAGWLRPMVPGPVIAAAHTDRMPIPLSALRRGFVPSRNSDDVDLFLDPPPKPDDNTLGQVPPPQAQEFNLEHTSRSLVVRSLRRTYEPPPLQLVTGETLQDYMLTWLSEVREERFVRERKESILNGRLVVELLFENISARLIPPRFVLNNVRYSARYVLSWVRFV
jgi:hypothetical protein